MNLRSQPIIYVTRDIERALGMEPSPTYRIVTNRTSYGESIKKKFPRFVTLIDDGKGEAAGTGDLLESPATNEAIAKVIEETGTKPFILIFKNTARIEPIVRAHGWTMVNPPAATIEKIENKISQVMWLGDAERFLPRHRLETMKNASWPNKPFILQWGHGYTGGSTILISSAEQLEALKTKFPYRRARFTEYIEGPSFTMNVVVTPDRILPSSVSYQITGLAPFTDSPFATIGNDWSLANKLLTEQDMKDVESLALELGAKMQKESWRGLFGIDFIKDAKTGAMYLIEINARQPASTTYESQLQEELRTIGDIEATDKMTTMEAHIAALLGEPVKPIIPVRDGAQIIQRITQQTKSVSPEAIGTLELAGFTAIPYENTGENSDLIRVQSRKGLLSYDAKLNEDGMKIVQALS